MIIVKKVAIMMSHVTEVLLPCSSIIIVNHSSFYVECREFLETPLHECAHLFEIALLFMHGEADIFHFSILT